MLRRRTGVLVATLLALALPAGVAHAAKLPPDVQSVVDDFRTDGVISPCKHTVAALEQTSRLEPSDLAQLSPDFPPAVSAALEARKKDDCGAGKEGTGAAAAAAPTASAASGASGSATAAPSGSATATATASPAASPSATATATPVPTATPPPAATPAPTPALTTVHHEDPVPLGLWILVGILAFAAILWLVLFALGRLGWGEERLAGPRHAWGEARYRAGSVWGDFTDWLRLGR